MEQSSLPDSASDENVREDEEEARGGGGVQNDTQKKSLKEIARKLWLAVEVGDKLGSLQILKSQTQNQA